MASFFTRINHNTTAPLELLAGSAKKKITVRGFIVVCAADVAVTFQRNPAGADPAVGMCGPMPFGKGASGQSSFDGMFWTNDGDALEMLLGAAVQVGGVIWGDQS